MRENYIQKFLEDAGDVYASLSDQASRDTFERLLLYRVTKDITNMDWIIRHYTPEFKISGMYSEAGYEKYLQMIREKSRDKEIVIYGAGANGKMVFEGLMGGGDSRGVKAFCDRQAEYKRYKFCGVPVISLKELAADCQEDLIVVSAYTYADEIVDLLTQNGIVSEHILFSKEVGWGKWYSLRQYFEPEIMNISDVDVFVDGGAYDGSTFREFLRIAGKAGKKVLAFEPTDAGYELCRNRLITDGIEDVKLYKMGLWSNKETLSFRGDEGQLSHVSANGGNMEVECVALDDIVNEIPCMWNKAGTLKQILLKLDVEGTELKALQGAREIIRKYAPKLAVCIYHNPHDIIEIPAYLKMVQPNYKFYIRHYSNYLAETVLYAV